MVQVLAYIQANFIRYRKLEIMKKYIIFPMLAIGAIITACSSGSGSNGNSGSTSTAPQKTTIFVPVTKQSLTPSGQSTDFSQYGKSSNSQKMKLQGTTASCINLVNQANGQQYSTAISGSSSWSTASVTFTIQNNCGMAESFSAQAVLNNLQINGSKVTSTSASVSQTGSPYMPTSVTGGTSPIVNIATPTCSGQWCSWAQLASGAQMTFVASTSYGSQINTITLDGITLDVTMGNQPPAPGSILATINTSAIVSACGSSCANLSVSLVNSAGQILGTQLIPPTTNGYQLNVQNLAVGNYNVVVNNVPNLSSGNISYTFNPSASLTVGSGQQTTESITFAYQAVNTLNVALAKLTTGSSLFANPTILGRIVNNATGGDVQNFTTTLGGTFNLSSAALITGESYTLEIQGLADPSSGTYFAPIIQAFTVDNVTTNLNLSYSQVPMAQLKAVSLTVESAVAGQTIAFASDSYTFIYNTESAVNGTTLYFSESDTVNATVSSVTGYSTSTTPSPAIISNGAISGQTLTVKNSPVSNNGLMVGYLNQYYVPGNDYVTISQAAQAGYNVQVIAFATLSADAPMQLTGNMFLAYTGSMTFAQCSQAESYIVNDIAVAKQKYGLKYVLISVGGAANSFTFPSGMTTAQINSMAQNVVNFLNQYGIDGIDFDVEMAVDGAQLQQLIQAIKALSPHALITAAPQSFSGGSGPSPTYNTAQIVTTGTNPGYIPALQAGLFNYVWLQGYNTGSNFLEATIGGTSTGYCDETMPCFIPAAFGYYTSSAAGASQVPSNTSFIIGEPATASAGGEATVWYNTNYSTTQAVYNALASSYQMINGLPQSGGAMTWSVNQDVQGGCGFANAVAPVVSGISQSNIVCPSNGGSYWLNICTW
jgi:chitinase